MKRRTTMAAYLIGCISTSHRSGPIIKCWRVLRMATFMGIILESKNLDTKSSVQIVVFCFSSMDLFSTFFAFTLMSQTTAKRSGKMSHRIGLNGVFGINSKLNSHFNWIQFNLSFFYSPTNAIPNASSHEVNKLKCRAKTAERLEK